jgi:serine protease Do
MSAAPAFAAPLAALHSTLGAELGDLADALRRVTVRIHTGDGHFNGVGAGVLWPSQGRTLVVTNAHVVPRRRGNAAAVETSGGRMARSRVLARSTDLDLALLAVDVPPDDSPHPATIGRRGSLRVGEVVVALGHPFGIQGALSVGVVHAIPNDDDAWLTADIRLAPGNSGGPLATLDGAVVGINCMIVRGLGVAVPARVAEQFVAEALASR